MVGIFGTIYKAIDRLATLIKDNFWSLSSLMEVGVVNCLDWKGVDDGDMKKMQEALCQLAVTGFFPVEKIDDPICRVMGENNVGGVVSLSSVVVGLPVDVWKRTEFEHGLVPSKQSMRLTIAKVMHRRKLLWILSIRDPFHFLQYRFTFFNKNYIFNDLMNSQINRQNKSCHILIIV
jgi:hypothetical protein